MIINLLLDNGGQTCLDYPTNLYDILSINAEIQLMNCYLIVMYVNISYYYDTFLFSDLKYIIICKMNQTFI